MGIMEQSIPETQGIAEKNCVFPKGLKLLCRKGNLIAKLRKFWLI